VTIPSSGRLHIWIRFSNVGMNVPALPPLSSFMSETNVNLLLSSPARDDIEVELLHVSDRNGVSE